MDRYYFPQFIGSDCWPIPLFQAFEKNHKLYRSGKSGLKNDIISLRYVPISLFSVYWFIFLTDTTFPEFRKITNWANFRKTHGIQFFVNTIEILTYVINIRLIYIYHHPVCIELMYLCFYRLIYHRFIYERIKCRIGAKDWLSQTELNVTHFHGWATFISSTERSHWTESTNIASWQERAHWRNCNTRI